MRTIVEYLQYNMFYIDEENLEITFNNICLSLVPIPNNVDIYFVRFCIKEDQYDPTKIIYDLEIHLDNMSLSNGTKKKSNCDKIINLEFQRYQPINGGLLFFDEV